jgi:hypothetical protein
LRLSRPVACIARGKRRSSSAGRGRCGCSPHRFRVKRSLLLLDDSSTLKSLGRLHFRSPFARFAEATAGSLEMPACGLYGEGSGVIHEGVGRVEGAVTGRGWLGVPGSATAGTSAEAFQSSIRSRWAGGSVVRCSRAQSSSRLSSVWLGGGRPLTTHELARVTAGRLGLGATAIARRVMRRPPSF